MKNEKYLFFLGGGNLTIIDCDADEYENYGSISIESMKSVAYCNLLKRTWFIPIRKCLKCTVNKATLTKVFALWNYALID
jgi:hypothetical protein